MSLTRRQLLERAAALGATVLVTQSLGCDDTTTSDTDTDAVTDDTDDGLEVYTYDGEPAGLDAFEHGVSSGDPLVDAVLLWTRVTRGDHVGPIDVFVEVSADPTFAKRLAVGWYSTDADRDDTLTLDAADLTPGTTYYYRFSALGRTSPVGRTRTLPTGAVDHLRLGVCSCSNYAFGYFHAYRHLANRPDLDAVLHLGDYIYEYANEGSGRTYGTFRELEPANEIVSLDDYRTRYAHYRKDADLQELHRQNAFIHVWDDHEFANDPEIGGADNHSPDTEGPWNERRDNALQAYTEWLPTRLADGGRIWRSFGFGDLATLVMLDRQRPFLWPDEADDHYLGKEQADWLDATIAASTTPWLVFGQGTRFGSRKSNGGDSSGWDTTSRQRTLDAVKAAGIDNLVVLTGDIHKFEALDIVQDPESAYDEATGEGSEGVEVAVGSISSPGVPALTTAPQFFWSQGVSRGYMVVDITPARVQVDAYGFHDLLKLQEALPDEQFLKGFVSQAGANHLVETTTPVATGEEAPELAP